MAAKQEEIYKTNLWERLEQYKNNTNTRNGNKWRLTNDNKRNSMNILRDIKRIQSLSISRHFSHFIRDVLDGTHEIYNGCRLNVRSAAQQLLYECVENTQFCRIINAEYKKNM